MLGKIKKVLDVIFKPRLLKQLISMNTSGYLSDIGWINSFKNQLPIDKESNPIPWVTYGFIDFISERLTNSMDIFEYGSGNSTLWYAKKVASVTSIEHDKAWYDSVKKEMPKNVNINFKELVYDGEYSKFSSNLGKKFDIIIDGRDRVNCIKNSIDNLKEGGIVILDDSERVSQQEAIEFMLSHDFKKIDFWGISPGLFYKKNTTIFYKQNNCLNI